MYKLCTFITLSLLSLNIKAQETGFKIFKTNDFKLAYPENWKAAKDGNVYNFFLKEELGDISISIYKNCKAGPWFPADITTLGINS